MVEATYTLHADADGDELFAAGEALIDVVRDAEGITYSRGLDGIKRLDEARAGDFGAFLDNRAGTYNPGAAGEILRGVSLKLQAAYGGTTRALAHVDVSRVKHWPALTRKAVELKGRGKLARLARRPVSTTLYQNITTGQAIGYLLDAAGYPKNAQPYITSLTPAGQWGMGGAAGTETDLSGNGNDATMTYAAGQRGATALDDGGDGATKFLQGLTNIVSNPVFGHGTFFTGWTPVRGTQAAATFADHPLASFGVTTGLEWTVTGNYSYPRHDVTSGITDNADYVAVVIWRRVSGTPNESALFVFMEQANVFQGYVLAADPSLTLPVGSEWYITAISFEATAGGAVIDELQVAAHAALGVDTAGEVEIGYVGLAALDLTFGTSAPAGHNNYDGKAVTYLHEPFDLTDSTHALLLAAGNMGTGHSWSGTAHASTSTRVATKMVVPDNATIQNVFDGGGGLALLCNLTSDGQGDVGRLIDKAAWYLNVQNESGGNVRLNFRVGFSGTDGIWQSAVTIPLSTPLAIIPGYNADATTNDPTIYVINLSTGVVSTLTVGSGLTETSTPVGTRTTDVGSDLIIGNNAAGTLTASGDIDEPAVFTTLPTAAQAKAWAARCLNAPRHLDAGQTTLPFYYAAATDALQEIKRIVRSEGPGAYLYEDASGAITFLNRQSTITQTRSNTAQGTLRGTGTAPLYSDYDYEDGLDDVINVVEVSAVRRALSAAGFLWQSQQPYALLAPGGTKKVTAKLTDPGTAFETGLLSGASYGTTLAAALNDTDLTFTIPTGAPSNIGVNTILDIDGELIIVASRTTGSPNDTITTLVRGNYGTTAASHLISATVNQRAFIANSDSGFAGTNLTSAITVALSRTGGISTEYTFTNTGATPAYLFARLYGQEAAIQERYELKNTVDASASIAAHGEKSYDLDVIPEVAVDTLQDWCNAVVGWYQDGRPTVTVEVDGNLGADEMAQALDREIADRVRVIHAGNGVDLQALVHRIEATVELGGGLHRARLLCESADTADYFELDEDELDGVAVLGW